MKKTFFYLVVITTFFQFSCAVQSEKSREVKQYTIEQFMNTTNIGGGTFSADKQEILLTSDQSGIYNIYTIPAMGGTPAPLTQSDTASIFGISFFPEDNRVLFRSDDNGDEVFHIFRLDPDGSITDLTPDKGARATFYGWNRDNKHFFYVSNKRDPKFMDLYEMNIETFQSEMLFENTEGFGISDVSPDKRYIALDRPLTSSTNELFLFDREMNKMVRISPENPESSYSSSDFSLDGKYFYYLTDEGNEFSYLVKYEIETAKAEKFYSASWDVQYAYFSYNEKYLVIGVNEDARTRIYMCEAANLKPVKFPEIEAGEISYVRMSKDETMMSFFAGSSRSTNDLYVYKIGEAMPVRITKTLNPEINQDDLVEGKVVRYKSFDGTEIPAILYLPHQASSKNKVPCLVDVHGGPGGQSTLYYDALGQYLINHGYAIISVNNRGSSGYGKTFYRMDDRNHGEGDLMDCIYAKNYLATTGKIDTTKIGILGGSYGGFMVMAALTTHPEAFATGVNLFGVTNWLRTLQSIPPWWEAFRKALYDEMGDPAVDSARLYRISPLFHAEKITRPFMVLQGSQDPRVLQAESDEIVAAARANGVPVEYVLFDDEGHGFVKKDNQIEANSKILQFLDKYLKTEVAQNK